MSSLMQRRVTFSWLTSAVCLLVTIAFACYQLFKPKPLVDFAFIYTAGKLWLAGISPYSYQFSKVIRRSFPDVVAFDFVYPPNWFFISSAAAFFEIATSRMIWQFISVLCFLVGIAVLGLSRRSRTRAFALPLGAIALFTVTSESFTGSLFLGQTSGPLFLGASLFAAGAPIGKNSMISFGLALLSLKPNLALPFFASTLLLEGGITCIALAAALALFLAGPALMSDGPIGTLHNYLIVLSRYNNPVGFNAPSSMTGISRILSWIPSVVSALISAATAFGLTFAARKQCPGNAEMRILIAGIAPASTIALCDLHNYDLALCSIVIAVMTKRMPKPAVTLACTGAACIWGARRLALVIDHDKNVLEHQSLIATMGAIIIFSVIVGRLVHIARRETSLIEREKLI